MKKNPVLIIISVVKSWAFFCSTGISKISQTDLVTLMIKTNFPNLVVLVPFSSLLSSIYLFSLGSAPFFSPLFSLCHDHARFHCQDSSYRLTLTDVTWNCSPNISEGTPDLIRVRQIAKKQRSQRSTPSRPNGDERICCL